MTNGQIRDLCIALLHAESEQAAMDVLKEAGYWDKPGLWRHYGDLENNWGTSGNQQSLAEAALAEKLVNSVDARLINECMVRGINPKDKEKAPQTISAAVAMFFEEPGKKQTSGLLENWTDERIRKVAQGITLTATGNRPTLNLTIADIGEGQTPRRLPSTILSLSRSNKNYIPFVQGQFNQGGTGALRFCGVRNLQLVISRRNPALLGTDPDDTDTQWGFTIVRRERASEATDGRKTSVYTFLAPVGVGKQHEPRHGEVLSFSAATMPLFPNDDVPYGRETEYGTAIKLYEYQYVGERSNIIRGKQVILRRLELLLPEIALPVRLHEFRKNAAGKILAKGSRENTLVGLRRRLIDNENVEDGFPISINFSPKGEKLIADVFVFKPEGTERDDDDEDDDGKERKKLGGIKSYRKREGVVFVRNGQTQGSLPRDYFKRDTLKLKPLAEDMLVFVDCDNMDPDVREDLFMPSRDRLAGNAFKDELIDALDQALKSDDTLKQLRNKRQQERVNEQMKNDRPLDDVLQNLIKSSPNLTQLLQLGQRISAPFNTVMVTSAPEEPFRGEIYPTFFKIKNVEYGEVYKRNAPINQRMRLTFETDARDDYFRRRIERGGFSLVYLDEAGNEHDCSYVGPNLKSGIASVTANLPDDCEIGDVIKLIARTDDTQRSFESVVEATVKPPAESHGGGSGERKPPQNKPGHDREAPRQLSRPKIERVFREDWEKQKPPFDEFTGMRAEVIGYDESENEIYEFRVNMDNTPLLNEIKLRRLEDVTARNQFLYANVLIGLSLLLHQKQNPAKKDQAPMVDEKIEETTRALAPFLLALTTLSQQDLSDSEDLDGLEAATG
ncbi:hypothetical protein [Bradyrhizobium sp. ORS 111]|uniref:hypothetical protein n=1 Tax=Bradyrhizobium sp. ORS 111 TaxID=1685958 RepID=UPI00388E1FE7